MRYHIFLEPLSEKENLPGYYYAHVPSMGLTTHGKGIDGALEAARDLLGLWVEEKRQAGEEPTGTGEALLASVELS